MAIRWRFCMGLFIDLDAELGHRCGHSGGVPGFGSNMRWLTGSEPACALASPNLAGPCRSNRAWQRHVCTHDPPNSSRFAKYAHTWSCRTGSQTSTPSFDPSGTKLVQFAALPRVSVGTDLDTHTGSTSTSTSNSNSNRNSNNIQRTSDLGRHPLWLGTLCRQRAARWSLTRTRDCCVEVRSQARSVAVRPLRSRNRIRRCAHRRRRSARVPHRLLALRLTAQHDSSLQTPRLKRPTRKSYW